MMVEVAKETHAGRQGRGGREAREGRLDVTAECRRETFLAGPGGGFLG